MRGGIEPGQRGAASLLTAVTPTYLLAAAVLASGVLLLILNWPLMFMLDDWDFLLYRPGWSADTLLDPHNEHISLTPIVVYKLLLATFGLDSGVPFRVVSTLVFLLSAVLLFVYLRRRVGGWLSLIATTVILFLGAAYEDLLSPFQIGFFGSMSCGLGMLLALEREDRTGDRLACVLLTGSLTFSTLGLPFAAGAAVDLWQRRTAWRSRIYVVAIPAVLFAAWWLGWGHTAETSLSLHNIGTTPLYVLNALADGFASLLGLVNTTLETTGPGGLDWGRPLLPVVALLVAWRLHRIDRLPRWFWIALAIGASFWILAGFNVKEGRGPTAPRYQYPSVIFILLIGAELLRGVRVQRNALIGVAVVGAAALAGNLALLFSSQKDWKREGELERAALGAVEIGRGKIRPDFVLVPEVANTRFVSVGVGPYLEAVDDYGSPAYTESELVNSPEAAREAADKVLATGLRIELAEIRTPPSPAQGTAPDLIGPPEALVASEVSCLTLDASGSAPPLLDLPRGGATLTSESSEGFQVRLRRFASTSLPVDLGELQPSDSAEVMIPTDSSQRPWKLSLDGAGRVSVCGLAGDR